MYVLESWVGDLNGDTLVGKDAVRAIRLMSLFGDILRRIYVENELFLFGYAITGVCDDSCGAIEMLTYGESTEYPNQLIRSWVSPSPLFFLFRSFFAFMFFSRSLTYTYFLMHYLGITRNLETDRMEGSALE